MLLKDRELTCLYTLQLHLLISILLSSAISSVNKEVEANTDATISCVITGITRQLDNISWKKADGNAVAGDNYEVKAGTYDSNSQTTTLTVKAAANTVDSLYTCSITSSEWEVSDRESTVVLDVFGTLLLY